MEECYFWFTKSNTLPQVFFTFLNDCALGIDGSKREWGMHLHKV